MEAHRETDNVQQKASDCLGTVNEKPYTLGRIIYNNGIYTPDSGVFQFTDPDLLAKIEEWKRANVNTPQYDRGVGYGYTPDPDFYKRILFWRNDNPKKD